MATVHADPSVDVSSSAPASASDYLAQERRLQGCLRTLRARGWQQRLAPLAQHMAERHLVCARGYAGAPLHRLDLHTLREALSSLLREGDEDGCLIFELVIEGAEPAAVAAERGVSTAELVDMLRDAVDALAVAYEDAAFAALGESEQERVPLAPGRKKR